jgi:NADPH:quinone reductase-like Zn-dependent oxidoreductase
VKAVRFHEYGGPDVLRYEDAPDPDPGPREVVVRVRAVGLNHVDVDMRSGTSRLPLQLPHTLGFEVGGDVAAVGAEVDGFAVGDRVTPLYQVACRMCRPCVAGRQQFCERLQMLGVQHAGGYAEYVVVPEHALVPLPDGMSYDDAASTQTTFATAWHCLITRAGLRAGETVLISAAGSGVGSSGIQVAKRAGARVITSAGSDAKLARAAELGADVTVNYNEEDLTARVREATDGRGVDVVLEHVGGDVFTRSLDAVAIGGRVVVCGGHAGEVIPLDLIALFRNEWSVIGGARATEEELRHVIDLVGRGELTPVISDRLALSDAADAHRLMEERRQFGKILLHPA